MPKPTRKSTRETRTRFTDDFKQQAVQMILGGHSAASVARNLGIKNVNKLYRWKAEILAKGGQVTEGLDESNKELRAELLRTQRERDILKKPWPFSVRKSS
ncbi:MAG: transposase [Aureliella sp.]